MEKTFEVLYNELALMGKARIMAILNDKYHNFIDMRGTGTLAYVIDGYDGSIVKQEIVAIKLTDYGVEIFSIDTHYGEEFGSVVAECAKDVPDDALKMDENYYLLDKGVFFQLATIQEILSVLETYTINNQ